MNCSWQHRCQTYCFVLRDIRQDCTLQVHVLFPLNEPIAGVNSAARQCLLIGCNIARTASVLETRDVRQFYPDPISTYYGVKMVTHLEDEERASFSGRLKAALIAGGHGVAPSRFVSEFNLRADGLAVTVHAARKWLTGEAIPAQARLQVIANWLGINAAWLRFGDAGNSMETRPLESLGQVDSQLASDICLLSASNKRVLRAVVESMLREENEQAGYTRAPSRRQDR
jgi:hypothetical protein